jgi:hypothetical protein
MNKRWMFAATSLLVLGTFGYPESKSKASAVLDPKMPGVYISFEKTGPREPSFPEQSHNGIWLRLHNNYRFPIRIPAYGSDRPGEVGVIYDVEDSDPDSQSKRVEGFHPDLYTNAQLDAGKDMLFSLTAEELPSSAYIRVRFEIDDESRATAGGPAPLHYAIFYASRLSRK